MNDSLRTGGELVGGDPVGALCPDENRLLSGLNVTGRGEVYDDVIHAHRADDRAKGSPNQDVCPIGRTAGEAVSIAEREHATAALSFRHVRARVGYWAAAG